MKKIVESTESLSEYYCAIQRLVNEESTAIASYDEVLKLSQLPASTRSILEEIRNDEKDHLVLLTNLLQDIIEEEMPDNGDEDMMKIFDEDDPVDYTDEVMSEL